MYMTLLTYSSFVIASLFVIVAFITSTTYTQLAVAILLYPLIAYFAFKIYSRKAWSHRSSQSAAVIQPIDLTETAIPTKKDNFSISDVDKRLFLKLIGGAGIFYFIYSIFSKKTEGLFSGIAPAGSGLTALKDTAGNKINPAESQPLDGYKISEILEDNVVSFYGFTNKDGAWFVMKVDTDTGSVRYSRGDVNFSSNWTSRRNLRYDYFSNVF